MAITVKYDLLGSEQTRGISSDKYDRATRRAYVEGIDNGAPHTGVGDAIEFVRTDSAVQFHQSNSSLPLQAIGASRMGINNAILTLYYGRRRTSILNQVGRNVARFHGDFVSREWYRLPPPYAISNEMFPGSPAGAPFGPIKFAGGATTAPVQTDPSLRPQLWIWQQPAIKMFMRSVLTFNPLFRVGRHFGKINSAEVYFGGMRFPQYTLLFSGFNAEWEASSSGSVTWMIDYEFTHAKGGFLAESVHYFTPTQPAPPGPILPGFWFTKEYNEFDSSNFLSPPFP